MICGIGVDIIKVERMRETVAKWGERFLRRVFTDGEIAYCYERKDPFPSLSARFAAKEALIKALSIRSIRLTDIEVVSRDDGSPCIEPKGKFKEFSEEKSFTVHLSLSHERDYGIAFVVIEKDSE